MLNKDCCRIVGYFFLGFSATLVIPLLLALYYQFGVSPELHPQPHGTMAFFQATLISLALSGILLFIGKNASGGLYRRESIAAVIIIWFMTPLIGGLPFWLSDTLKNPAHAYFEAVSGFTTTGSTMMHPKKFNAETGKEEAYKITWEGVLDTTYTFYGTIDPVKDPATGKVIHEGIEAVSKALLFWRSFVQFLGGGGIVILFVAILPALGVGGKILYQTEATGPIKDALTPRIKETAIMLWKIYLGLTTTQIVLLMLLNPEIEWLDAFTISFSTLSTGGFSIKNASIAAYNSISIEWIVIVFMVLGSINFSIYYYAFKGKFYRIYDTEFILYIAILAIQAAIIVASLTHTPVYTLVPEPATNGYSLKEAFRDGVFQAISAQTSTGFTTANFDRWPYIAQAVMLISMFFGGMSGSTAGGIKIIRVYILFRIAQFKVESLFRPESVRIFKVGNREIDMSNVVMTLCFFVIVIATGVLGTFVFILNGLDPQTALSIAASSLNNIGLGFRMAGPIYSWAFLSDFSILYAAFLMLIGRLEFFVVLALLTPSFWRQKS